VLTSIEINENALLHNADLFRKLCGAGKFGAVIKSNGYGHGMVEVASILRDRADWFCVNSIAEALTLREKGFLQPILVMGAADRDDYGLLAAPAASGIVPVLSTIDEIERLHHASPQTAFHLKVDTGMSRLGMRGEQYERVISHLSGRPELPWHGVMTHFANVEDVTDQSFALEQLRRFHVATEHAKAAATHPLMLHTAASAAALILPESRMDLCRIGIALYGLWPSRQTRISALNHHGSVPELRPVLRFRSTVVHLNRVDAGSFVGYGCTYKTVTDTVVAVVPVGYFEGYERSLSNRSHLLIRGKRARVIGRVCMNMIMADVTHIGDIAVGDEVVLIGRQGDEEVPADELADLTHTINYEVVTRIQQSLPRIVVR